jgi:hypothetical protein
MKNARYRWVMLCSLIWLLNLSYFQVHSGPIDISGMLFLRFRIIDNQNSRHFALQLMFFDLADLLLRKCFEGNVNPVQRLTVFWLLKRDGLSLLYDQLDLFFTKVTVAKPTSSRNSSVGEYLNGKHSKTLIHCDRVLLGLPRVSTAGWLCSYHDYS